MRKMKSCHVGFIFFPDDGQVEVHTNTEVRDSKLPSSTSKAPNISPARNLFFFFFHESKLGCLLGSYWFWFYFVAAIEVLGTDPRTSDIPGKCSATVP